MKSDVSDDDSDSPSYNELLDLVDEQPRAIKKQTKKCNALNDLNATLATNYDNLLCKFNLLSKEHEELKLKTESIKNGTNGPFEKVQSLVQSLSLRQMLLLLALI